MPDILSGETVEEVELQELHKEITFLKNKTQEFLSDLDFAHAMCMGDADEFAVSRVVAQEVLALTINLQREVKARIDFVQGLDAFGAGD